MIGHTTQGMDFAPRLAVALRRPLIAGCVEFENQAGMLILTRQIFNAKMNMRTSPTGEAPYLATASPGAFPGDEVELRRQLPKSFRFRSRYCSAAAKVLERIEAEKGKADLTAAPIIVSGGRGLKQKENFN